MPQEFCNTPGVFCNGMAVAEDENGWFHVLPDGKPAYEERYDLAEPFQVDGTAWVRTGKIYKRINKDGTDVPPQASTVKR